MTGIVALLLLLAVIGVAMWLVHSYVPRPFNIVLNVILGIIIVVIILRAAGIGGI